jgi:hypothetical protein
MNTVLHGGCLAGASYGMDRYCWHPISLDEQQPVRIPRAQPPDISSDAIFAVHSLAQKMTMFGLSGVSLGLDEFEPGDIDVVLR